MASLKAQKPAGTQSASTKKGPVKAGTSFPTAVPLPTQAVASPPFSTAAAVPLPSQLAPKKAQPKPQEPKKKV